MKGRVIILVTCSISQWDLSMFEDSNWYLKYFLSYAPDKKYSMEGVTDDNNHTVSTKLLKNIMAMDLFNQNTVWTIKYNMNILQTPSRCITMTNCQRYNYDYNLEKSAKIGPPLKINNFAVYLTLLCHLKRRHIGITFVSGGCIGGGVVSVIVGVRIA